MGRFHDGVDRDQGARRGFEDEVLDVADDFASPGTEGLQQTGLSVVADLYVAHGHAPGPKVVEQGQADTACGLRSWSEPGTGSDGSAPSATMRLSWSTCTTRGTSARASASVT